MEVIMSRKKRSRAAQFPFPILALIAFLAVGFLKGIWHPTWLVFLTIPIYYYVVSLIESINEGDGKSIWKLLPYPLFCAIAYICLGFLGGWWHPAWLIFLTIPIWSFFVSGNKDNDEDVMEDEDDY